MQTLLNCKSLFFGAMFVMVFSLSIASFSRPAEACCDNSGSSWSAIAQLVIKVKEAVQNFLDQMSGFMNLNFLNAQFEVVTRFMEFDQNTREEFSEFWSRYLPALQEQTKQLNTAEIEQTRSIGSFIDATNQSETVALYEELELEAHRRFRPSDNSCQAEGIKATLPETEHLARAMADATNKQGIERHGANVGSISAEGPDNELSALMTEMQTEFCAAGQAGCAAPGALPLANIMITERSRGVTMTHNLDSPAERAAQMRAVDNFVSPRTQPLTPASVQNTAQTQREFAYQRRPLMARKSLLRYLAAEDAAAGVAGPANLEAAATRIGAGIPAAHVSNNPSMKELAETQRERLLSQVFFDSAVTDPETLLRQMADMKEQQLRTWVRIKKINERRLALLSAELGHEVEMGAPNDEANLRSGR